MWLDADGLTGSEVPCFRKCLSCCQGTFSFPKLSHWPMNHIKHAPVREPQRRNLMSILSRKLIGTPWSANVWQPIGAVSPYPVWLWTRCILTLWSAHTNVEEDPSLLLLVACLQSWPYPLGACSDATRMHGSSFWLVLKAFSAHWTLVGSCVQRCWACEVSQWPALPGCCCPRLESRIWDMW